MLVKYKESILPSPVCITYISHMKRNMALSGWFAYASFQALVHALFPFWFVTSSTENARRITHFIKSSVSEKFNLHPVPDAPIPVETENVDLLP
jgi:hypothetical protein